MTIHQVFTGCRLFCAVDETVIKDGVVWIEGDVIRYAGPAESSGPLPKQAKMQDVGGRFVMPGMTETHAHLSFADESPFAIGGTTAEQAMIVAIRNSRLMLAAGFTSAVSFGSTFMIDVALRAAINEGRIIGPRLLAAGRDIGATASNVDGGSGLSQIVDGPWEARKAVREQRKLGVDIVKIFIDGEAINPQNPPGELSFTDEEVHALVDEAHRRNLRIACHARSAEAVKQAVRAGADLIGHANYLDDEAVELIAEHKDTIFVGPAIAWEVAYLEKCESLGVSKEMVRKQGYEAEIEATIVSVSKLRAAGIRLVVGGDYGISIAPHGTYARDLEYFVELFGMSPAEALICATRNGGLAADPSGRRGTLQEGSLADMVIVDGDPLADIKILQDLSRLDVIKGGVYYRDLANDNPYLVQC
jgi:imidazolonepropionase-like amidohydrolase